MTRIRAGVAESDSSSSAIFNENPLSSDMFRSLRPSRLPDDIHVELIEILFRSLRTVAIAAIPSSAVIVAAYVASSINTPAGWGLAVASLVAVAARLSIILYSKHRVDKSTLAAARKWAAVYGASVMAITGVMSLVTTEALAAGGTLAYVPTGWCIATALGITARTSMVPWIPIASSSILLLPIALAAFFRPEVEFWLTGGLILLILWPVYDCVDHLYSTCVDRLMARRDAAQVAQTDVLTGLGNRLAIQSVLAAACVGKEEFALLYVDLDGFKAVNDGHGHSMGDALLIEVAARLRHVAGDAFTARIGGDEFGMVKVADETSAARLAAFVVDHLCLPYHVEGRVLRIGASVGVALGTGHSDEPAALLHQADEALYRAKAAGKGQWKAGPERNVA